MWFSLEYDEIWTLKNWVPLSYGKILTTFGPPNNHPLNSVFIKMVFSLFPGDIFWMRLPNLLCGTALLPLVYLLAKKISNKSDIAVFSMILVAFHPGLIYYSHCARGYSMVSFFVTLFAYLTCCFVLNKPKLTGNKLYCFCAAYCLCMIAACMTFSAAILFIAPIMLIHLFALLKLKKDETVLKQLKHLLSNNKILVCTWILMSIFALWLYAGHYQEFMSGTGVASGIVVNSLKSFMTFLSSLFPRLIYWTIIPFIFLSIGSKQGKKLFYLFMFIVLFSLVSIFIAKGAPARAYLPIVPMALILAAYGINFTAQSITKLFKGKTLYSYPVSLAVTAAILYPAFICSTWAPIDWFETYEQIKKIPISTMLVYRACESYPLSYNVNEKIFVDNFSRISRIRNGSSILFFDVSNRKINGTNTQGGETSHNIHTTGKPLKIGGINSTLYKLKKLSPNDKINDSALVAVIPFMPLEYKNAAIGLLRSQPDTEWLLANFFLTIPETRNGRRYSSAVLLSAKHNLNANELIEISRKTQGKIRFFTITEP